MSPGLLDSVFTACPRNARLIGIDLGTKTIGLAVCDPGQTLAVPLDAIARTKFRADMAALARIFAEIGDVGGLVFGWPLNMDGTQGAACDRVRSFIDEMQRYPHVQGIKPWTDLWIALVDERLSTETAMGLLNERGQTSFNRRKKAVDSLAAKEILQGALYWMNQSRRNV